MGITITAVGSRSKRPGAGGREGVSRRGAALAGLLACALAALALPAAAAAVERFASPSGLASGSCETVASACTLERAVEDVALDGDVVTVLPGVYLVAGQVATSRALEIRGAPGQPRPVIWSTASTGAVQINDGAAVLRRVEVRYEAMGGTSADAVTIGPNGGTVEQVAAFAEGTLSNAACAMTGYTTAASQIRDSLCVGTQRAVGVDAFPGAGTSSASLHNVTAAGSRGVRLFVPSSSDSSLSATNVIAVGPEEVDVFAEGPGSGTVELAHSNYDDASTLGSNTVTPPGSGTNQTALPRFLDPAAGDYHQAPDSPTIDAGTAAGGLGSADFDGEARLQGAAPDIGADEFTPPPPGDGGDGGQPQPGACPDHPGTTAIECAPTAETARDGDPPDTEIARGPKRKIEKRSARFRFGSDEPGASFECKLDRARFKPCGPRKRLIRLDDGRHRLRVRAVDLAGNVDPTPAKRRFEVVVE